MGSGEVPTQEGALGLVALTLDTGAPGQGEEEEREECRASRAVGDGVGAACAERFVEGEGSSRAGAASALEGEITTLIEGHQPLGTGDQNRPSAGAGGGTMTPGSPQLLAQGHCLEREGDSALA
ncbi:unnamed protein product, partial [Discosporangium mesarthrocarpum]